MASHKPAARLRTVGLLALCCWGCASATVIQTNPEGALLRMDGASVGQTPYLYQDTSPVGTTHIITLEKPGYSRASLVIKRDQANAARVVLFGLGGLVLLCPPIWLGLIWAADYQPLYEVELAPDGAVLPSPPMQAPPPYQPPPQLPPVPQMSQPPQIPPAPQLIPPPPPVS